MRTDEETMHKMNEKILLLENEAITKSFEIEGGFEKLNDMKIALEIDIASQTDENGKALYSNETKRKAAYNEIVRSDHPIEVLRQQLKEDKRTLELKNAEIKFMKRALIIYDVSTRP